MAAAADGTVAPAEDLPPELGRAAPRRRAEFAAGRYCARQAIARLDRRRGEAPGRGTDGAPIWPAGLAGSITHTGGFVSAAVAPSDRVDGIGIDSERIVGADVVCEIADLVARPGELDRIANAGGLDRAAGLSLCFSAKEALYKCLYPLVRRFFDYPDAEVVRIDPGEFIVHLRIGLGADFPAGLAIAGRYAIDPPFVHTGIALTRRPAIRRPADAAAPPVP